jgi:hypothetical protein
MKQRHGLRQIDNVNFVAGAKNETIHFRIPAVGLVTKVNASFQKLTHGEFWQCHWPALLAFPVQPPRNALQALITDLPPDRMNKAPKRGPSSVISACVMRNLYAAPR